MRKRFGTNDSRRRGLSLMELLAVVSIVGIIAVVIVTRMVIGSDTAKANSCQLNKGNIEMQAELWYRNKGSWPKGDLSDIGANVSYFPDGLPTCPVDGTSYSFNSSTEEVSGHSH